MITRNEYTYLKKIDKNKVSEELLSIACQPYFMYDLEVVELSLKLKDPSDCKNQNESEEISINERRTLALIGRMLRRKLITVEEEYKNLDGMRHVYRYFEITDYGYNSMIEFRMQFKFWLPLVISILSIITSVVL